MGSDAEVFIFDYDAYLREVVPTFLEFLKDSPLADWLQPFVKRRELKPWLWDKRDLAGYLTVLNPDFSWAVHYDLSDTCSKNWEERWSDFVDATSGNHSLHRTAPSAELVEQVNWLFEVAISVKCLGTSQFVGRSKTVSHYSELLSDLGLRDDDRIVELLAALGKRGFLIGYKFGFGFEGVNGWLNPSETVELAEKLDKLPLPRYEVSFAAMQQFRTGEWGEFESPDFSSEALSLSFVRTTAAIAAQEHRGLLWGNGVMPRGGTLTRGVNSSDQAGSEFGKRDPTDVLKLVVKGGIALALSGVGIGVVIAFGLTRLMEAVLFEVNPTDALTFAIGSLALVAVAGLACYVPARRATKVDPLMAMRQD